MPGTWTPYPPEFRERIIALARAGRSVEDLAREFEPRAATIHGRVKQADRDGGRRCEGLTREEQEELRRLRRSVTRDQGAGMALCVRPLRRTIVV